MDKIVCERFMVHDQPTKHAPKKHTYFYTPSVFYTHPEVSALNWMYIWYVTNEYKNTNTKYKEPKASINH